MVKLASKSQFNVFFASVTCYFQSDICPYQLSLRFRVSLWSREASRILPGVFLCTALLGKRKQKEQRKLEYCNCIFQSILESCCRNKTQQRFKIRLCFQLTAGKRLNLSSAVL